ncbi:4Fe-4S binding protein [Tepidibacter aestuarii]|uniref:4Fe-4S binding protein n=1 Tax=Tepidibacter aestuarii TaxID=2925782 RepID=UPI0020BE5A32|nr:4Fe-4S binding protein [Tepidibacter aestuarii]CAH2213395.1 NosR/NirI family transcriptional regulator, nitrous oxide reductase regulator [Tepidibacter aestuarii]
MKNRWTIRELYLGFLAISLLLFGAYSMFFSHEVEDYSSKIYKINPNIVKTEEINKSPLIFKAYTKNDPNKFYFVTFTEEVGYQSTIEVMTMINNEGNVEQVEVVKEGETPAFFDKVESGKFNEKFIGLSIFEPIYIDNAIGYAGSSEGIDTNNKVDAVSGSTISSSAITRAVNDGTTIVVGKYFDENIVNPFYKMTFGLSELALLLIYIIAALSVYIKSINKYRKWILLYTALVLGFKFNKFVTFGMLYSFLNGNWPAMNNVSWYLLITGTIGLILITGKNLYCSWICPFGATQEVILKFGGLKQIKLNSKIVKIFRLIPPTLAYLALMIVFYTNETQALAYDPFGAIFNLTALPIMWMSLPILIFISLFQYRFYCTYFCPIGLTFNLITKLRNKGVKLWKKEKIKA